MKRVFILLLAATALFIVPIKVKAANNGDLVQAVGDSKVYYIEGVLKRHIADHDTFQAWGFNAGLIRKISKAELNNHPTGPQMTRVIMWGGTVYYVENATRRYIPTSEALAYYGHTFAEITLLNTDTFFRLPEGSPLSAPKVVQVPGDSRVFLLDGGQRWPFINDSVMQDGYGYTRSQAPVSATAKALPVGPTLNNVIQSNGNVYYVGGGGKKYHIGSEGVLLYNNLKWSDMARVSNETANALQDGPPMRPPALIRTPGSNKIWLTDDDGMRWWVPNTDILNAWGYTTADIRELPNSTVYRFPEVGTLSRFVRRDFRVYYIIDGERRRLMDPLQERMFGLDGQTPNNIGLIGLTHARDGGDLAFGLSMLDGISIPATSGKTAKEQHLYLNKTEADLGRTDASATQHYGDSGTSAASQNGMAGGYGSFGSEASPASADQERYYITMRWGYCDWYENPDRLDSFGHWATTCRNINWTVKNWFRHKKVIVINPANSRQMVLSVEESGPAIWTGRVSGLSPEAMNELGAVTDSNLSYYWAANQNLALGRIR